MRIGSLFSGTGALDMAVEAVFPGAAPAWFCEWDDAPSKVLAHHWPDVPNLRDVTVVDWSQVEPVDIITGGSPCQDLSAAGRRAGMTAGTRSNLWVNMREAIAHLSPRYVVWENVLGALSATATSDSDMEPRTRLLGNGSGGHLRALGRVLGDLSELRYDAQWSVVRASDVGAPHHRARVFLLASSADSAGVRLEAGEQPVGQPAEVAEYHGGGHALPSETWGEYAPVVRRWERVTRPAPVPVESDQRRLNVAFAEWMQGLPEGHVTGVGISRAAQLKAIGNGICVPQAVAALRSLLKLEAVTA